jgi:hypothetical protein
VGRSRGIVLAAFLSALLTIGAGLAQAHVAKRSGPFEVELGWGEEPPFVDADNSVELEVADAHSGAPVAVPAGALAVEVAYGGTSVTLPLAPATAPGTLEAPITPTRPGTYSFSVTGDVQGHPLDVSATCSQSTFECVEANAGDEFPVKDPSAGELAQRANSEAQRLEDTSDRADGARTLAQIALALGAVGLAMGVAALAIVRRRGSDGP